MINFNRFLDMIAGCTLAAVSLSSCDNVIYEDLDPCLGSYSLSFCWDHNMLFVDAFKENVGSVAVYGFDPETELLRWVRTEKGEVLSSDDFKMSLDDVEPGTYTVVAWCGLENDGERSESFRVPDLVVGQSTRDDLICRMEREIRQDGTHHSSTDLYDLFHGTVKDVKIFSADDPSAKGDHIYKVNLKKDTNSVRIILQQLSGNDVEAYDFNYKIEESNGLLNHDNSLLDDEPIIYHEWQKKEGYAGVDLDDYPEAGTRAWTISDPVAEEFSTRATTGVKVAIADLTTSRLMADRKTVLTVSRGDGTTVAKVPLTDYALLIKDNYGRKMSDQEYLDRQDHYTLTFFIDKNHCWSGAHIVINSWRVVLNPNISFD